MLIETKGHGALGSFNKLIGTIFANFSTKHKVTLLQKTSNLTFFIGFLKGDLRRGRAIRRTGPFKGKVL